MNVAVIGAGGAGLSTAWLLDADHQVTLYEREPRLGGHAHTIAVDIGGAERQIDAGFEFISAAMFPTLLRLLHALEVPLAPYPMLVTMFNAATGHSYLMPPFHGWRIFPSGFAPDKVADLLRFTRILRAARPLMRTRDTTLTVEDFLDQHRVPQAFRARFMYPYLQAGWGATADDIKTFAAYDVLMYSVLNTPATLIPHGWVEIVGGTQTYVRSIARTFQHVHLRQATAVERIERTDDGYRVLDSAGGAEVYDHIVLATNANQAAAVLVGVAGAEEARTLLSQFSYFETTIAVHGDTRLMPPRRQHWSTVNIRYDGQYSQFSMWRPWRSPEPIFRSWVTHDRDLPEKLYATAKYWHPRVTPHYFALQRQLQRLQGRDNLWLAGVYMHDVDSHESAVLSAVNVARRLAPASARLKLLTGN